MEWNFVPGKSHPGVPARVQETPHGTMHFKPLPPRAPRDLYKTTINSTNWLGIQEELVQFWVKVCDVLIEYYGEPQRAEWNRLLCTIELIPAFVRAQARLGEHDPESARNVTVFAGLPWVEQTARALEQFDVEDERWMAGSQSLYSALEHALAASASCEPAKSCFSKLQSARQIEVMTRHGDNVDSMRPLHIV